MANNESKTGYAGVEVRVPESASEAVVNRLFELGATGVEEDCQGKKGAVRGFFPASEAAEVAHQLKSYLESLATILELKSMPPVSVSEVTDQNWAEKYKEFYHARKMTDTFYLVPEWERQRAVIPAELIPLYLEPGQAFGTGLHPSTTMSMHLLERALKAFKDPSSVRVIDVGTGTGILAIAAEKLGVGATVAIDNDPIAVSTAKENCARNHCASIRIECAELAQVPGVFDVVVSNILFETHRTLLSDYGRHLTPGGYLILSGLLADQRKPIHELFLESGFVRTEEISLKEWSAVSYYRPSGANA